MSDRLSGWKQIAEYVDRSERTAQRWHDELGMPVHRMRGKQGSSVYASRSEIDQWLASRAPDERGSRRWIPQLARTPVRGSLLVAFGAIVLTAAWLGLSSWGTAGNASATNDASRLEQPIYVVGTSARSDEPAGAPQISPPPDYFTIAGHWLFDGGSGDIAVDRSGNGNDGRILGPSWINGISHGALSFDGVDDVVEVPTASSLEIRGAVTIEAVLRCKPVSTPLGYVPLVDKSRPGETGRGFFLNIEEGEETCRLQTYFTSGPFPVNEWVHVAFQQNGVEARFYVDYQLAGVLEDGTVRAATPNPDVPLRIGRGDGAFAMGSFAGDIDEIRISVGLVKPVDFIQACRRAGVVLIPAEGPTEGFPSIQAAVAAAPAGSRIEVGPGAYGEVIEVHGRQNVSIVSPCGATVGGFDIRDSNDVTIHGFDIDADGSERAAVFLHGGADANGSIRLGENRIHSSSAQGVLIGSGNQTVDILANDIYGNAGDGIGLAGEFGEHYTINYNRIERNGHNGIDLGTHRSVKLAYNTISHNGVSDQVEGETGYGVRADSTAESVLYRGITLIKNLIYENGGQSVPDVSSRDLGGYDVMLNEQDRGNETTCGCERGVVSAGGGRAGAIGADSSAQ